MTQQLFGSIQVLVEVLERLRERGGLTGDLFPRKVLSVWEPSFFNVLCSSLSA